MTEEAPLEATPSGLRPTGDGWFVVNVRDTAWVRHDMFGAGCVFENRQGAPFPEFGINVSVLQPGQPAALYHEENAQEDFLVLAGECVLLVNGEQRPLRTWDFFHSPAGTEHVIVGGGDTPSVVLAVGTRPAQERLRYPDSDLARRHGAGAHEETTSGDEAYGGVTSTRPRQGRPDAWDALPWA
jgi:uncharacterized cupin superfamily protein